MKFWLKIATNKQTQNKRRNTRCHSHYIHLTFVWNNYAHCVRFGGKKNFVYFIRQQRSKWETVVYLLQKRTSLEKLSYNYETWSEEIYCYERETVFCLLSLLSSCFELPKKFGSLSNVVGDTISSFVLSKNGMKTKSLNQRAQSQPSKNWFGFATNW